MKKTFLLLMITSYLYCPFTYNPGSNFDVYGDWVINPKTPLLMHPITQNELDKAIKEENVSTLIKWLFQARQFPEDLNNLNFNGIQDLEPRAHKAAKNYKKYTLLTYVTSCVGLGMKFYTDHFFEIAPEWNNMKSIQAGTLFATQTGLFYGFYKFNEPDCVRTYKILKEMQKIQAQTKR